MSDDNLEEKLNELMKEFGTGYVPPRAKADKKLTPAEKLAETLTNMKETVNYLRVCIKYLVFDLEATKRENQYLKGLLEGKGGQ